MRLRPEGAGQIYLYRHPVDMRKSINGLVAIVEGEMALDPFSASLFVFCNRARTLVKMVGWEGRCLSTELPDFSCSFLGWLSASSFILRWV